MKQQRQYLFTAITQAGIKFHIEASNQQEARFRASDKIIGKRLAQMMIQAVENVEKVEPFVGPVSKAKYPIFTNDFFE